MEYKVERVKTGIPGLDKLVQGGFVEGSSVLISGEAGTGKTSFGLQFLWEGLNNNEPGLYISFEQTEDELKKDALTYGMDFEKFEKKKEFKIIEKNLFQDTNLEFFEVDKIKAKRIVIDSISLLSLVIEDKAGTRNKLNEIINSLKQRGTTILMLSEISENEYSRLGVEEYMADGVILLKFTPIGAQSGRNLFIKKMRRTRHSEDVHPIQIGNKGIKVLSV